MKVKKNLESGKLVLATLLECHRKSGDSLLKKL
jgi:hypothetical protein